MKPKKQNEKEWWEEPDPAVVFITYEETCGTSF